MAETIVAVHDDNLIYTFAEPATLGAANTLIAAPSNALAVYRICQLVFNANGANEITFFSDLVQIGPLWALANEGGFVLPYNENGWMKTVKGDAFKCTLLAGTAVGVLIGYKEVSD